MGALAFHSSNSFKSYRNQPGNGLDSEEIVYTKESYSLLQHPLKMCTWPSDCYDGITTITWIRIQDGSLFIRQNIDNLSDIRINNFKSKNGGILTGSGNWIHMRNI